MSRPGEGDALADPLADALLALRLCARDRRLGGVVLRGAGPAREAVVAALPELLPLRRVPPSVDAEALIGGLDLGATLASGRRVAARGLLAAADGGAVLLPMAERIDEAVASHIAAALDTGEVGDARDRARIVAVALDDGVEDERLPTRMAERLAFRIDLSAASPEDVALDPIEPGDTWPSIAEEQLAAIAVTAAALGVASPRAMLFAARAAQGCAALDGRVAVDEGDVIQAARLVLAHRATRLPPPADDAADEAPPPDTAPPEASDPEGETSEPQTLEDRVVEAVRASLPSDVLAALASGARARAVSGARGAGERRRSPLRGRPKGAVAGLPRGGKRLALIDTLRAAAPWQRLRGKEAGGTDGRVRVRKDDLRIRRYETRAQALTIFAVDASGSSALARLAEAKGAVELLLAEAYVARAEVALIAFRGTGAELLLPPTRSLARAKLCLADLAGGGGTPIATGLAAALDLAVAARTKGRTPYLVVLSDGRANVAADGSTLRETAMHDAEAAARMLAGAGVRSVFVDIAPRPRPEGERLAAAMAARYLPLPRADAHAIARGIGGMSA